MSSARPDVCPVCGYELGFSPWVGDSPSDEICPSCGIQFGYDDAAGGSPAARAGLYEKWRSQWMQRGCPWSSVGTPRPNAWDPRSQMRRAGVEGPT
jgi:hypothetical protein